MMLWICGVAAFALGLVLGLILGLRRANAKVFALESELKQAKVSLEREQAITNVDIDDINIVSLMKAAREAALRSRQLGETDPIKAATQAFEAYRKGA
jgi:hypothetical protein